MQAIIGLLMNQSEPVSEQNLVTTGGTCGYWNLLVKLREQTAPTSTILAVSNCVADIKMRHLSS